MLGIYERKRLPLIAAPMFLVSGLELVRATCKEQVVGTFPALNQRTTEGFQDWVQELNETLGPEDSAYGVNLIVHRSNPRLEADLEVCVANKVPLIITSLGAVQEVVDAVHSYGGLVFHDVTTRRYAEKAAEAGVDGLILVSGGAGGHAGFLNPFGFFNEVREFFDKTILLAGSISTGRDIAAAKVLGADFAYVGTRFVATQESNAQPEYKQMVCDARTADIVHTPAVSGVPANFMRQSLEANGFDMKELTKPGHVNFGEKLSMSEEAKAWKTIWSAGHGAAAIHDIPSVKELVARMEDEYAQARSLI